jgi:hypothetical protein
MFDEVNVATALHRLAKLQPPQGSAGPAALFSSEPFVRLVAAAATLLPRFGAQAVSNTLWAFATLGYFPADDLLDRIGRHAAATMSTFRPQATSNTLWAMAKLGEEFFLSFRTFSFRFFPHRVFPPFSRRFSSFFSSPVFFISLFFSSPALTPPAPLSSPSSSPFTSSSFQATSPATSSSPPAPPR